MGGGGGGTRNVVQTSEGAQFPREFRPLASAAVQEILGLQQALPINQPEFTAFQPRGTADIQPLQQEVLNRSLSTLQPTAGLQGLLGLPTPVSQTASNALAAGQPTSAAQTALGALGNRFGATPQMGAAPFSPSQLFASSPQSTQLPAELLMPQAAQALNMTPLGGAASPAEANNLSNTIQQSVMQALLPQLQQQIQQGLAPVQGIQNQVTALRRQVLPPPTGFLTGSTGARIPFDPWPVGQFGF